MSFDQYIRLIYLRFHRDNIAGHTKWVWATGTYAMHKNLPRPSIRWGLVGALLCTMSHGTSAGSFTRGCAARDLQILMLIEDRESTNAVPEEALSDAMLAMLEARIVCHEGRVMDAMALYDDIAQSITPDTFRSAGRH
jgi:hypothetical protein